MSEETVVSNEAGPAPVSFDIQRVLHTLPHRYPLLLVDRVASLIVG